MMIGYTDKGGPVPDRHGKAELLKRLGITPAVAAPGGTGKQYVAYVKDGKGLRSVYFARAENQAQFEARVRANLSDEDRRRWGDDGYRVATRGEYEALCETAAILADEKPPAPPRPRPHEYHIL